jgi:hypothetical protein
MARKRLLTILAAVTAAITLQVGPAAAADECLVLGEDVTAVELASLSKDTCVVDKDGKLVQGTLPTKDTTEKVEETTKKTTETTSSTTKKAVDTAKSATAPAPKPTESPAAPAPKPAAGGEQTPASDSGSTSGSSSAPSSASSTSGVAASGSTSEAPEVRDPARDRQLGALQAIRSDLAAGTPFQRGVAGPVQTFGDLATTSDLAAPQIAEGRVTPDIADPASPDIAPATGQQEEALLASSTPMRDIAEAPLALQLLAAALVLGAAAVWTIAARELGKGETTTA